MNRKLFQLHFTVFVWGFTAIFGALITIPALELVWYRMLIAFLTLFAYLKLTGKEVIINKTTFWRLIGIGCIVAAHWVLFYHTIKISTISVALVTLSAATLFISLLNPIINRRKISKLDLMIGLIIILGIYLIFKFETKHAIGIITGLASAFAASVFTIINEKQIKNRGAGIIGFYEMIGGFILLSAYLVLTSHQTDYQLNLKLSDLIYLLILGTACTAFAYVSGVSVMKELSAYTVALATNLEPVYGIVLAFLIFGEKEKMTVGFYTGTAVILAAHFLHPVLKRKLQSLHQRRSERNKMPV